MTTQTLALPADCNREAALALHERLALWGDEDLCISAASVEKIGQSMLQVLLAMRMHNPATTLVDASTALRDAARLTGIAEHLLGEQAA